MTSIMGSTPLAMKLCGLPAAASAGVIQWHMLGMFIPSLFTGELIRRFGLLPVISGGVVLIGAAVATAVSGQSLAHFVIALSVLGVGWNFLFIGGSTLLLTALRPGEQARGQGCYDFVVFGVASASSFASGGLLVVSGWNAVATFTLPLLLLAAVMIVVLWSRRVATHQE
jgi:MFS family permease